MSRIVSAFAEDRTLTELDAVRLRRCIRHAEPDSAPYAPLDDLIDAAQVVPARAVDADVVTMRSRLRLRFVPGGDGFELTLCYPDEAAPATGHVSVLSPLGSALIGVRVGHLVQWQAPDRRVRRAAVESLLYQPEAAGDAMR